MLSKDARDLLRWLAKNDKWMDESEITRQYKRLDTRSLKTLASCDYLEKSFALDNAQWIKYRISDLGKAYLEGSNLEKQSNFREWTALILSAAAVVISIIALLMQ